MERRDQLRLEVLEDESDLLGELPHLSFARRAPANRHLPLHPAPEEVRDEPVQRDAERALPRPRRPHHDHELPFGNLQVHPVERGLLLSPITVAQIPDADCCVRYFLLLAIRQEYSNRGM